mgnify:CR=1 FL=1
MANIKSAKKRILVSRTRADRNKAIRSGVKTAIKKVYAAIETGDKEAAKAELTAATKTIEMATSKGVYHKEQRCKKGFPSEQSCQRNGLIFLALVQNLRHTKAPIPSCRCFFCALFQMSLLAASFQADPADCLPPVSYTLYTISLKSSMMYICQIPILVQAQICTWLIVYTKRTSAQYTMQRSFLILYLIFLCLAFLQLTAVLHPSWRS